MKTDVGDAIDLRRLSRVLSFALRHAPEALGLSSDERGAIGITELLSALRVRYPAWRSLNVEHLVEAAWLSGHQRFEVSGGRIRALYGHSMTVCRAASVPPAALYHGTRADVLGPILREGLKPMGRSHVHLTTSTTYARRVVNQHCEPVLLTVDAGAAFTAGIAFFQATALVWLSEYIPPAFLAVDEVPGRLATPDARRGLLRQMFGDMKRASTFGSMRDEMSLDLSVGLSSEFSGE